MEKSSSTLFFEGSNSQQLNFTKRSKNSNFEIVFIGVKFKLSKNDKKIAFFNQNIYNDNYKLIYDSKRKYV